LQARRDGEGKRRAELERQLNCIKSDTTKVVDLLLQERASLALRERLRDLERKRTEVEADIADVPAPAIELLARELPEADSGS
jgi:hypothetical protein